MAAAQRRGGGATRRWRLWLSALGAAQGQGLFEHSRTVRELTPEAFEASVRPSVSPWFVDFYAHWCPHCQNFAPMWESVAKQLAGRQGAEFAGVDCAVHYEFCSKMGVEYYPTMRGFHVAGGELEDATGVALHVGEYLATDGEDDLAALLIAKLPPPPTPPPTTPPPTGPPPMAPPAWSAPPPLPLPAAPAVPALATPPAPTAPPPVAPAPVALAPVAPAPAAPGLQPRPRAPPERAPGPSAVAQRMVDAAVAIAYSLRQGTRLHMKPVGSGDDGFALSGGPLRELVAWLEFLADMLPTFAMRSSVDGLARFARRALDGPGLLRQRDWEGLLARTKIDVVPPEAGEAPEKYFQICRTYTCGLWTTFHVVTANAAELGGGWRGRRLSGGRGLQRRLGAGPEALARVRGFVSTMFGCADCVAHFSALYDGCAFDRCSLGDSDGAGAALWLWQVHNNVTRRTSVERGFQPPDDWPPRRLCSGCWRADGSWEPKLVYRYLADSYAAVGGVDTELQEIAQGWEEHGDLWSLCSTRRVVIVFGALALLVLLVSSCRACAPGRRRRHRQDDPLLEVDPEESVHYGRHSRPKYTR